MKRILLLSSFTVAAFAVPIHVHAQPVPLRPEAPPRCPLSPATRDIIIRHTQRILDNPTLGVSLLLLEATAAKSWQEIVNDWLAYSRFPASYRAQLPPLAPAAIPSTPQTK